MHPPTHQQTRQPFLPKRAHSHHPTQPAQVTNIIARHPLQAKLKVGAPNDRFEQEADRVADRVMRIPDPAVARSNVDATPHSAMSIQRNASYASGGGCPACQAKSNDLKVSQPNDPAEVEADQIADKVMRVPNNRASAFNNVLARSPSDSIEEPDPITEGLSTVMDNLSENNPAFSEFTDNLANEFLSQPPALSIGVPVFLGANYAFLWGMAMANPAMRRHFNDFNIAMLPGIIPQFPIKTFTYRILNDEQTQFDSTWAEPGRLGDS